MVIFRFFLVISIFCGTVAMAENSNPPLLSRTEFTNQGLLNGINYNVWWYRAFSLGTSWDGPTNLLTKMEERADHSPEDAQELLLGLSEILKSQEPAGTYIINLYNTLLIKSQKNGSIPLNSLLKLVSDRSWNSSFKSKVDFNITDLVNNSLINFLSQDLILPNAQLENSDYIKFYNLLLSVYLNFGDKTKDNNLSKMVSMIAESNNSALKEKLSNSLFDLMSFSDLYFSRSSSEVTQSAVKIIELRKTVLSSIEPIKRKLMVTEKVQSFQVLRNDVYRSYFNFKKIEPDLLMLEQLGGKDALLAFADKIRQMVDLLESINKEISRSMARISYSVGYVSRSTTNHVSSSYGSGSGNVDSGTAARTIRAVRLRNNTLSETRELIQSVLNMCDVALTRTDIEVLKTCANDLVSQLLIASNESSSNDVKLLLQNTITSIVNKTSRYFDPSFFQTSCEELDLEIAIATTQNALKQIEELKVRVPEHSVFESAYGVSVEGVEQFMFVDCSKAQYSVLNSPRNRVILNRRSWNYENSAQTNVTDMFFVTQKLVASCIKFPVGEMAGNVSHQSANKISPFSAGMHGYLQGIKSKYLNSIVAFQNYHNREDIQQEIQLTQDEEKFIDFFESDLFDSANPVNVGNTSGYPAVPVRTGNPTFNPETYSGSLLPLHLGKICLATSSRDNQINCESAGENVNCKSTSLFTVLFQPKGL